MALLALEVILQGQKCLCWQTEFPKYCNLEADGEQEKVIS